MSVTDVVDALTHAFKDERLQPTITVLEAASDWSAFFASSLETIAGHSQPLGFRFARVESGPHAPVRMFVRDNSKGEWLGYRRTSEPIVVLKSLPRGNLKALPPLEGKDKDAQTHAVEVALSKHLIEQLEADELKRIIAEGTLGAQPLEVAPSSGSADIAKCAKITRPRKAEYLEPGDKFAVRLIDGPPRSVQPPPAARAARSAAASKPPVPLFYKPRVSLITDKPSELKRLREAAEREVAARESGASTAAPSSAPSSAAAAPASVSAAAQRKSPSPRRASRRTPVPRRSPLVPWDNIDED